MSPSSDPIIRNVIPASRVQIVQERIAITVPKGPVLAEPAVDVIQDGETIQAIAITCTCGQKIRVDCDYE